MPALIRSTRDNFQMVTAPHLEYVEQELKMRPWLASDAFTVADVMMSFPIEVAAAKFGDLSRLLAR